jgi:thiol-disulfide isomerase/thioredoxin
MKRFFSCIVKALFFIIVKNLQAADGYEIKVKINNLKKNDTLFLAYHLGQQKYLRDTAIINDKGLAIFKGKEKLPGGIYLIVLPKKTYFDIIVNEQFFYIENDTSDFAQNFKSSGSEENRVFYEDMKFISEKSKIRNALDDERKKEGISEARKKEIEEAMKKLDEEVKTYRSNIIKNNPKLFYSKVLKMMEEIPVPDPPKDEKGNIIDSLFQYKYYRNHYFDNIDFADDRLLRTPILHGKVMYYVEKLVPQIPDSINAACDYVLTKAKANDEMFKYWLIELLNHYAKSNIMGFDAVYVHLVENYYAKGMAKWANEADVYRITDRAKKLKPTLIGQIAPRLVLKDLNGVYRDLYQLQAKYTLLYIYDPDCGHCKKETPKFLEAYQKIKSKGIDLKVYAVSTDHLVEGQDSLGRPKYKTKEEDLKKWPNFVEEHKIGEWVNVADLYLNNNFREVYDITSTPRAFLLDRDKKIIAKRFAAEQLEQIIDDLEKYNKKQPSH